MVYGVDSAAEVRSHLPAQFRFGVATSSWQIEGSSHNRGESIWDRFAKIPGAIVDGSLAEPACDHVGRLEEDLNLIAQLGVDSYRFSVSWPRFIYDGVGEVFPRGADFYDRLVDGLLSRGITPLMTCYHWDLPQVLQDKGGWLNPDTGKWFADYAHALGERYGDRVSHVATLNEPWVSAFLGYAVGVHAPGIVNAPASLEVAYRLMVASGRGITALRDAGVSNPGIVLNLTTVRSESEKAEAARAHIDILQNSFFTDLLAGRPIPETLRENTTHLTDWSFVEAEGLAIAATPISWLGVNYYTPIRVAELSGAGQAQGVGQDTAAYPGCPPARLAPRPPYTTMGWEVDPSGLTDTLLETSKALPGIPLWVSENGAAFTDRLVDGGVYDPERIDYVGSHLVAVGEAITRGAQVQGYCLWSLLDNIEWAEGRTKTFGIVHVAPDTLERTPKSSYDFYKRVVTAGR
jgi:beta-glucosidase